MAKASGRTPSSDDGGSSRSTGTPGRTSRTTKKAVTKKTVARKTVSKKTATKKTATKKTATRTVAKKTATPTARTSRKTVRQGIRCYLCGQRFEVSAKTMSTTCTACHKAIKVEDVQIKSYLPVNDLQTCGHIKVTKRGRVAAKRIQSGRGIECEGTLEGSIEADGSVHLGSKAAWKGALLQSGSLKVDDGATLVGHVSVPWEREEPE
jgi:Zn finger protein HypA/HybF involved in hydrogenase expression